MSGKVDFDYDEFVGMPVKELEEKLAKYVELLKEISRLKGLPTAEYDEDLGKPYLLYPDGRRVYND